MTLNYNDVIWALGPRGKYAHAYPGLKGLHSGVPLCGLVCFPTQVIENFDPNSDEFSEVTCPACLARLALAKYMKPIGELYRELDPRFKRINQEE